MFHTKFKGRVSSIFLKKQNLDLYKMNPAQSSLVSSCTCVMVTVSAEPRLLPPFRWCRVGAFPPANESAQVMVGVDTTYRLDAIQTGENCACR